jgi:hypothetical protein
MKVQVRSTEGVEGVLSTISRTITTTEFDKATKPVGDYAYAEQVSTQQDILHIELPLKRTDDLIDYVVFGNRWTIESVVGVSDIPDNISDMINDELTRTSAVAELAQLVDTYDLVKDVKEGSWEDIKVDKGVVVTNILHAHDDPAEVSKVYRNLAQPETPLIKGIEQSRGKESVASVAAFETVLRLVRATMF